MDFNVINDLACKSDDYLAYETPEVITWCGGCGNYAIQNALKRAMVLENIHQQEVLMCFDIGCNGNGSDKIEGFTIHGLHGRVLPLAAGAKIANPSMRVIASAGDGATLSEGVNHFVHAIRNDYPMLFLLHDNENYALTIGQASSTTPRGCKMSGAPDGVTIETLNPVDLALSCKPSFVARTFSSDVDHMTEVFRAALGHTGFGFVHVLQTCPTFNRHATNDWYLQHVKDVSTLKQYDEEDLEQARKVAKIQDPFHIGVLYRDTTRTNFLETLTNRQKVKTTPVEEVEHRDITQLLAKIGG